MEHAAGNSNLRLIGLFILQLLDVASGEPRGVAVFSGGRGGKIAATTDQWGVLSPATKVLVGIFCLIIAILVGIGLYRFYKWCHKPPA
ncbi:hypothetical protein AVEN_194817-1 [Araneus ventricosus]|uniref:Uncharacterized protein n=1 Tax=Araneus ventricosus TaxID=182803 RepID=A0A4Y2B2K6_ARAVE|nr:hypothetical protein AVEN_194817-1 [Araneus ventricosus]